ncbi:MAG TPA: DUF21 domain-containing protein [Polyangiales bacterium]|nr:DUF21 domain-containing protein [Polyangiales bacterium]
MISPSTMCRYVKLWVSRPMAWMKGLLWPLVISLEAIGNSVLRLLGIRRGHSVDAPTRDALRFMVEQSASEGELGAEAGSVLEECLPSVSSPQAK